MEVRIRLELSDGKKIEFRRIAASATKAEILAAFRGMYDLSEDDIVKIEKIVVMSEEEDWDAVVKPLINVIGTQQFYKGVYGGLFKTLLNGRNISKGTAAAGVDSATANLLLKQLKKGGNGGEWEVMTNG